jgi:hypothetical protein
MTADSALVYDGIRTSVHERRVTAVRVCGRRRSKLSVPTPQEICCASTLHDQVSASSLGGNQQGDQRHVRVVRGHAVSGSVKGVNVQNEVDS